MRCKHAEEGKSSKLPTEISQTVGDVWTRAHDLMSADHVKRIGGPHIMIVFSPDRKEARDSRHVWPAELRVNFIQQHRFPFGLLAVHV